MRQNGIVSIDPFSSSHILKFGHIFTHWCKFFCWSISLSRKDLVDLSAYILMVLNSVVFACLTLSWTFLKLFYWCSNNFLAFSSFCITSGFCISVRDIYDKTVARCTVQTSKWKRWSTIFSLSCIDNVWRSEVVSNCISMLQEQMSPSSSVRDLATLELHSKINIALLHLFVLPLFSRKFSSTYIKYTLWMPNTPHMARRFLLESRTSTDFRKLSPFTLQKKLQRF